MKNLSQFQLFDVRFFDGLTLGYVQQSPWTDHDTGAVLGSRVELIILRDENEYRPPKDGSQPLTNKFEKLTVKVPHKVDIQPDAEVELVNPVATIYGDYRNQLSVKADDVRPVSAATKQASAPQKLNKSI